MSSFYSYIIILSMTIVVIGVFRGYGDNRKIIVFNDYDDLGLSFLAPASGILLFLILVWLLGINSQIALIFSSIVSTLLFVLLWNRTYIYNNKSLINTILAFMTKIVISIVWLTQIINVINPIGKNDESRKRSRGFSAIILFILTPILGMLVVDKRGSLFNPVRWIRGERVDSLIRNNM